MTQPTDIDPSVLAQSVFGLLMRSGRPRSEGLGRTIEVEQESGEAITFTMLASNAPDAAHVARVRVWLAERLVLDVELDRTCRPHLRRRGMGRRAARGTHLRRRRRARPEIRSIKAFAFD
jgi:hypothetical protein